MNDQVIFNIIIGVAGSLGGWWMKVMWETIKEAQHANKELVQKVASLEVLIAGDYVKHEQFDRTLNAIFAKLDLIMEKIDRKADK